MSDSSEFKGFEAQEALNRILDTPEGAEVADLLLTLLTQFQGQGSYADRSAAVSTTAGALGLARVLDAGITRICQAIESGAQRIAESNRPSKGVFGPHPATTIKWR